MHARGPYPPAPNSQAAKGSSYWPVQTADETGPGASRSCVCADDVIATSQPLAAEAGLAAFREGGNAVDAALAAAITLTVVEPTMNGVGSDAFALLAWPQNSSRDAVPTRRTTDPKVTVRALNASGRAPAGWTPQRFAGRTRMPAVGWDSATVPGAPSAWLALSQGYGRLPFARLFARAIELARDGFIVSPLIAQQWGAFAPAAAQQPHFAATFLTRGQAAASGQRWACPALARTLAELAETQTESFYRGRLAGVMAAQAAREGGVMTTADLAAHSCTFHEPLFMDIKSSSMALAEPPPNGQGLAALVALGILNYVPDRHLRPGSASELHHELEAMKAAFAIAHRWVADPATGTWDASAWLAPMKLQTLARAIRPHQAAKVPPFTPDHGTVYVAAADRQGAVVSFIQSSYLGFGSGVVIKDTGILLHNRGHGFSLTPQHPNQVAPGKRPYHTIVPGLLLDATHTRARAALGVMGGHQQPQGHVQLVRRMLCGADPQTAVDAARWHLREDLAVALEPGLAHHAAALRARGHRVLRQAPMALFGGAQVVARLPDGGWAGASDPRKDGLALGW